MAKSRKKSRRSRTQPSTRQSRAVPQGNWNTRPPRQQGTWGQRPAPVPVPQPMPVDTSGRPQNPPGTITGDFPTAADARRSRNAPRDTGRPGVDGVDYYTEQYAANNGDELRARARAKIPRNAPGYWQLPEIKALMRVSYAKNAAIENAGNAEFYEYGGQSYPNPRYRAGAQDMNLPTGPVPVPVQPPGPTKPPEYFDPKDPYAGTGGPGPAPPGPMYVDPQKPAWTTNPNATKPPEYPPDYSNMARAMQFGGHPSGMNRSRGSRRYGMERYKPNGGGSWGGQNYGSGGNDSAPTSSYGQGSYTHPSQKPAMPQTSKPGTLF